MQIEGLFLKDKHIILMECIFIFPCFSSKILEEIFCPRSCYHPVCGSYSKRLQHAWLWAETCLTDTAGRWDSWRTIVATELEAWLHDSPTWNNYHTYSKVAPKEIWLDQKSVVWPKSVLYWWKFHQYWQRSPESSLVCARSRSGF